LTDVLGFKPDAAADLLRREGFSTDLNEVRSRKGVPDGDDARVVRQTMTGPDRVELLYAVFRTKPEKANA